MEDAPVYGKHEWATCVCHGRDVLCCLTIAGARFDETVRGGGVCGCIGSLSSSGVDGVELG
jgi:hypothetical protein